MNASDDPFAPNGLEDPARIAFTLTLVHQAQAGDEAALNALFSRYLPRVRQIVALRLGKRLRQILEVEDIVQDVLLRAFRGMDRFQPRSEGSFRHWLARTVEREIVDRQRSETRVKRGGGNVRRFGDQDRTLLHSSIFAGSDATPSQLAIAGELAERLEAELLLMPPHERELIVLRAVCGMSFREVADEIGIAAEGTVRVAYHRAVRRLEERVT